MHGADLNFVIQVGYLALVSASFDGRIEIVGLLLGDNADVEKTDNIHITTPNALHVAMNSSPQPAKIAGGKINGCDLMYENKCAPLCSIIEPSSVLSVTSTVDYVTANMEVLDPHARTPLFVSAARGHTDIVRLLHAKGARVNLQDKYGATPLWASVKNGHREVAEYLLSIPGTLHALENDVWDRDLLWWALGCGSDDTLKLVRRVLRAAENSEADTKEKCKVIRYNGEFYWCSVCTRCLLNSETYQRCNQCDDFDICSQCVGFGIQCGDPAHTWEETMQEF